ncbi:hypothetical protein Tco_1153847 [Tanacetum coccineum]
MIVDIEDDIMDPVMQCTTLPSHSSFSQKKLVSFVTEIHTLSIDISLQDLKMEILPEPTSNKLLLRNHVKKDEEVPLVDGVFEGALGALGDERRCLEALEMEAPVDAMVVYGG